VESPEFLTAPQKLQETVGDLERRGLLQYDAQTDHYDLHPVVRGIAAGGLRQEEKERYGQRVVDHFSQKAHSPYEKAETLEDVRDGLEVVRTLLQMGRRLEACQTYLGALSGALLFNLEAYAEILSLLRPFFPWDWGTLPDAFSIREGAILANECGNALYYIGDNQSAFAAYSAALAAHAREERWSEVCANLSNMSRVLVEEEQWAQEDRCLLLGLDLATRADLGKDQLFRARLDRFGQLARIGQWAEAEAMWKLLDPMGRDWCRPVYRPGYAEYVYALFRFRKGDMMQEHLERAEQLTRQGKNRQVIRALHRLRGAWRLQQGQYGEAAESLHEAVRMAREVGQIDPRAETLLAVARFHLGQLSDSRREAERLAKARKLAHRPLAELWLAIGDREEVKKHALAAYEWAWADGEPYVRRYELNKTRALLESLGVEIPDLPPYDPAKDEKLPWEDEVAAAIEKLRAEKEDSSESAE
jgi:hypothetical protein